MSPPDPIDRDAALWMLGEMIRIRRFEEACADLYGQGKIRGFLHLYIGEEAIAVGAMRALLPADNVLSTYREHGHALARGVPAGAVMAEMFGKVEGCCRGRGGSMHLFDRERRFFGGNAIVGAGLPLAVGLALADKLLKRRAVTAVLFGDGAVAEGAFHESMNLAALWKLPVLFLCENNLYAMGTAVERAQSEPGLALKAQAYRMPGRTVDGMDVLGVYRAVQAAAREVREGQGPRMLELKTYRFRGHSMFDAQLYRTKEEVEGWLPRDPITTFRARMKEDGVLRDGDVQALEEAARRSVAEAVAFAEAGTLEGPEALEKDVYRRRVEP